MCEANPREERVLAEWTPRFPYILNRCWLTLSWNRPKAAYERL